MRKSVQCRKQREKLALRDNIPAVKKIRAVFFYRRRVELHFISEKHITSCVEFCIHWQFWSNCIQHLVICISIGFHIACTRELLCCTEQTTQHVWISDIPRNFHREHLFFTSKMIRNSKYWSIQIFSFKTSEAHTFIPLPVCTTISHYCFLHSISILKSDIHTLKYANKLLLPKLPWSLKLILSWFHPYFLHSALILLFLIFFFSSDYINLIIQEKNRQVKKNLSMSILRLKRKR